MFAQSFDQNERPDSNHSYAGKEFHFSPVAAITSKTDGIINSLYAQYNSSHDQSRANPYFGAVGCESRGGWRENPKAKGERA